MNWFSAREQRIDVVLVDTAGRMQDNEPLMRALSKVSCLFFFIIIFKAKTQITSIHILYYDTKTTPAVGKPTEQE